MFCVVEGGTGCETENDAGRRVVLTAGDTIEDVICAGFEVEAPGTGAGMGGGGPARPGVLSGDGPLDRWKGGGVFERAGEGEEWPSDPSSSSSSSSEYDSSRENSRMIYLTRPPVVCC